MITIFEDRGDLAKQLLLSKMDAFDLTPVADPLDITALPGGLAASLTIPFPAGLFPTPQPITPRPDASDALPEADVLLVTWTVAENEGLADVFTPGHPRKTWNFYRRNFANRFKPKIRDGAPSRLSERLGSYFVTKIGSIKVVCFKSELHLNQDGINLKPDGTPSPTKTGRATLPVKDLFQQIIDEVKPKLVITTGTAGGVFGTHALGDVVITRGAKFRLDDEFKNEPFNAINIPGAQYKSDWTVPTGHFAKAKDLMAGFKSHLVEPKFAPPSKRYPFDGPPIAPIENVPNIYLDGSDGMPAFHPILTTDFFEFGTSANHLETHGAAAEMGDAVLGMVASEMASPPKWLVVRNVSDPVINGDLPTKPFQPDMQAHWAVWYYETYGYWTSVNGALACWAVIAGI